MFPMMGGFPFNPMGGQMHRNMAETAVMPDTSEQVKISALALLKMLKHCIFKLIILQRQSRSAL